MARRLPRHQPGHKRRPRRRPSRRGASGGTTSSADARGARSPSRGTKQKFPSRETPPVTPPAYPVGGGRGTAWPARARERVRRELRAASVRLPDVFAPGTRLVFGFSGGQDSTCLLHALRHLRANLDLTAVHVDHALRADSAETARRVVDLAHAIGVACDVTRIDVAGYRQTLPRASTQQAARAARYQALALAARQHQAMAVLVAHT